jgi:predicted chitinase
MGTKEEYTNYLMAVAISSGRISNNTELAIFMAQMQHESQNFTKFYESMNYSAQRLLDVFGPYTDSHGVWHDGRLQKKQSPHYSHSSKQTEDCHFENKKNYFKT